MDAQIEMSIDFKSKVTFLRKSGRSNRESLSYDLKKDELVENDD